MKNLVTYGCSNTYGKSLHDRENEAWPYVLGKLLNYPVINNGSPGASNDKILRLLTTTDIATLKNSVVVIMWTYTPRVEMVYDSELLNIGHWSIDSVDKDGSLARAYYNGVYSSGQGLYNTSRVIHHAQCFLSMHDIEYHMTFVLPHYLSGPYAEMIDYTKWFALETDTLYYFRDDHPLAPDGKHSGAGAHADFANATYKNVFK